MFLLTEVVYIQKVKKYINNISQFLGSIVNPKFAKKRTHIYFTERIPIIAGANKNTIFLDPGKDTLLKMMNTNGEFLSITNANYVYLTRRIKYAKKEEEFRQKHLQVDFTRLTPFSQRTSLQKDINNNIVNSNNIMNDVTANVLREYKKMLAKHKFYIRLQTKKAHKKILNRITNKFGENIQFIYGDWNEGESLKYSLSTPNKILLELLSANFPVYLIDEFKSSQNYHVDKTTKVKNAYKSYIDSDGKRKEYKLHSVLYAPKDVGEGRIRLAFINRDKNACCNFKHLFYYWLDHNERDPSYKREAKRIRYAFNMFIEEEASLGIHNTTPPDVKGVEAISSEG